MDAPRHEHIERAHNLLDDYGPATAYAYMQQAGGLNRFPASLVQTVTAEIAEWFQADPHTVASMFSDSSGPSDVDVVLIDDDPALQDVVNAMLEDEAIRVEGCALGWSAQSCIRKTQPRVVILDIEMPDINGIQLFYLLRADPRTRTIRVIFLTGNPEKVQDELPNYEEMDALVPKPFDIERLLTVVTNALAA